MPIRDVVLRICRKQQTIRRCGERRSGISALIARHDDDDDDDDNGTFVDKNSRIKKDHIL